MLIYFMIATLQNKSFRKAVEVQQSKWLSVSLFQKNKIKLNENLPRSRDDLTFELDVLISIQVKEDAC